jgi:hypothetical protein
MLTVDAILKTVKIVILLKHVQIVHGKNVVAGLIYMSCEISYNGHSIFISSRLVVNYKQTAITFDF